MPRRWCGLSPLTWMAAAAWLGALVAVPVPLAVGPVVAAAGWHTRRTAVVGVGLLLLTSALAARTHQALDPADHERFHGVVTVVGDPQSFGPSLRVDLRVGDRRFEAWARGTSAADLADRLTGEQVEVAGRLGPPPPDAPWLARRHVVGRMTVTEVGQWRPGDPASRAANGLRRTLVAGARTMDRDTRSLYVGLLLGDQRDQSPEVADAFIGSGLTHLLAVSGQNVAFVLALAGPLLVRMRLGSRLVATLAVLGFFALVTRFEPSVLRATTMAGFAAMAVTFGNEADSRDILALAVVALLLVDPLIATQLAFQLSVAATTGILVWSRRIADALPGPGPLANAIGITVAAQLAVAPLLIPTFGGMPVAALVANVLAAPVTGPVVVWGLPAGIVAGVFGGTVAELAHLPTSVLVGWIGGVAERCAVLPLGEVRTPHLVLATLGAVLVWIGRRWSRRVPATVGVVVILAVVLHPAVVLRGGPDPVTELADGSRLYASGGATVLELDSGARPDVVLEALRRTGVGRVDVVVARHGGRDVAETVAVLRTRAEPRLVLAPPGHRVPGGSVAVAGSTIAVGDLEIRVEEVGERAVDVEVIPSEA
ncbi:MAG: ComEC/Rec2 family competence protein [Acidimicrobiales bacterium]|nr:ComEC/Rec2 family competence protein [Acidimicrobiales bacterium]